MPVVKDGQATGPSGGQRVDVATETHCTVATDTNFDIVPWVEPAEHVNPQNVEQSPLDSNADPARDDEYDSSDEKDSITPEILASNGCDPGSSKMALTDTPSASSDLNSYVGSSPADTAEENGTASVRDEGEIDVVESMQREITRLTNKINDLEDENQDLKINYAELHRSASVACYLEYSQRMELMSISITLNEVESENKILKEKVSTMEKKLEMQLGAMFKEGGGDGPSNIQ